MVWGEQKPNLPADIQAWQKEQQLVATHFVPLTYHGKTHGSLGFARRKAKPLSERDIYLASAYTKEAATAIERAYLYEAAREHELFAQTLANLPPLLNTTLPTAPTLVPE